MNSTGKSRRSSSRFSLDAPLDRGLTVIGASGHETLNQFIWSNALRARRHGPHRDHTDYPRYRARGWPIGSGITESGVKLFGERVKGTEQFWNVPEAESILASRSKWLSEHEESRYYWLAYPHKAEAA